MTPPENSKPEDEYFVTDGHFVVVFLGPKINQKSGEEISIFSSAQASLMHKHREGAQGFHV